MIEREEAKLWAELRPVNRISRFAGETFTQMIMIDFRMQYNPSTNKNKYNRNINIKREIINI